MTTSPVMSINDELLAELEAAANDTKGWELAHAYPMAEEGVHPEQWEWAVGAIGEDGDQYPVAVINCDQYDSTDTQKVARYCAAVSPATILALLAHIVDLKQSLADADAAHMLYAEQVVELERDAARYQWLRDKHNDENGICWVSVWDRDHVEWVSLDKAYVAGFDVFETGLDLDAAVDAAMQEAAP